MMVQRIARRPWRIVADIAASAVLISQKCVKGVYSGVRTSDLDALAAETAAYREGHVSMPCHVLALLSSMTWQPSHVRSILTCHK